MAGVTVEGVTVPKEATAESRPDLFGTRGQMRPDGEGGVTSYMLADKPEYATPDVSRVSDGFYSRLRGLPWHVALARQLGTAELMAGVDDLLTAAEVKAVVKSFKVAKVPVMTEGGIIIPDKYATIREDTGEPLGIVGRSYKVFQEDELVDLSDIIVDSGEAKYETGGHMFNGRWFFLSMELNHLNISVPGDPSDLMTYLLLMTSHDGTKPASYHITRVRTVCKNTSDLAKKGALSWYKFRHIGNLEGKVAAARQALGIAFKDTETVKELTSALATTNIVDAQVRAILDAAWPVTVDDSDEAVEDKVTLADKAYALYEASPNLDGIRGTAWGAYNAVTEYLDHASVYRGGPRSDASEARAASLLFGRSRDAKERALKTALSFVK